LKDKTVDNYRKEKNEKGTIHFFIHGKNDFAEGSKILL